MNKHIETVRLYASSLRAAIIENTETTVDSVQLIGEGLFGLIKVLGDFALRLFFLILIIIALPFVTWLRLKVELAHEKARKKAVQEYMERMTCLHNKRGANY